MGFSTAHIKQSIYSRRRTGKASNIALEGGESGVMKVDFLRLIIKFLVFWGRR